MTIPIGVDNKCSMRLLEQGTGPFKRAKHIKVRFFWLRVRFIDEGEITLIYVPSEELVADMLTVEFMYCTLVLRVLNTDTVLYYCTTVAL